MQQEAGLSQVVSLLEVLGGFNQKMAMTSAQYLPLLVRSRNLCNLEGVGTFVLVK